MITATATIVAWTGITGVAYKIAECPAMPECEGIEFAVPRDESYRAKCRMGERVRVKFSPDDQFAFAIRIDYETAIETRIDGEDWHAATWREFVEANADGIDEEEISEIAAALVQRGTYTGGGGAAPTFEIKLKEHAP